MSDWTDGDGASDTDQPATAPEADRSDGAAEPGTVPDPSAPDVERPRATRPSTEIPTTETPSTDPDSLRDRYRDVDPAFKAAFWKLVALYKFGTIGLVLGVLLAGSGTHPSAGPALAVGGAGLLGYAVWLTHQTRVDIRDGAYDLESDTAANPNTDDEPSAETHTEEP